MASIEHDRFELLFLLYERWSGVPHTGETVNTLASLLDQSDTYIQQLVADLDQRGLASASTVTGEVAITQPGINQIDKILINHPHLDPKDSQYMIN